jgi:phosphatidylglycerophosphatase A
MIPPSPHNEIQGEERFYALKRFLGTGFLSGYLPWAPGTWGSLVGLLIAVIPGVGQVPVLLSLIVLGMIAGVPSAAAIARVEGNRLSKIAAAAKAAFQPDGHAAPDPSIVVIDEIVGMWITLLYLPTTLSAYLIAFLAFRAMDIFKPPPARQVEHLQNGWGIMLDDVVAGLYANVTAHAILLGMRLLVPSLL